MGATIHTMCRLLERPDRRIVAGVPNDQPCGSRYSEELNGAVELCVYPDFTMRPTAFEVARCLNGMALAQGMRQQMVMGG